MPPYEYFLRYIAVYQHITPPEFHYENILKPSKQILTLFPLKILSYQKKDFTLRIVTRNRAEAP